MKLVKAELCTRLSAKELAEEAARQKNQPDGLKKVAFGIQCGPRYSTTRTSLSEFITETLDQLRSEAREGVKSK